MYFRGESREFAGDQLRDELEEFCQALPPSSYIDLRGSNGFNFRYVVGAAEPSADLRMLRVSFATNEGAFDLEAGAPVGDALHTLELLRLLLLGLIPLVIAIACIGGAWLSGRALKPVNDIAAAALTISIENLSERLPVPATGDEIARLTEVLNTMFGRLESAVNTLSQFVADASHELRTPLAVIRTSAELALRRARSPEGYRESLQEVVAEAERMTRLVEDLLILARKDAAMAEMPLASIDLRDVLTDLCTEIHGLAAMRQVEIKTSFGDHPAIVSGNPAALHRLFLVLLDNALKYSRPGGELIVSVDRLSVKIQDFGVGISETDLPHIFKRFYRADRARNGGGHGLGLALAESIAQAHGALIEVQSVEGSGSTFQVVFPPVAQATSSPAFLATRGA
jgi:signal transduction histidine kinase